MFEKHPIEKQLSSLDVELGEEDATIEILLPHKLARIKSTNIFL